MLKHLKSTLVLKVLTFFIGIFVLIFSLGYLLLKEFIYKHTQINEHNTLISEFNLIWLGLLLLFLLSSIIMYFLLNSIAKKMEDDVSALNNYLEDINNKNYDSVIKIENYMEFLHTSLLLKNIVKRLKKRDKK